MSHLLNAIEWFDKTNAIGAIRLDGLYGHKIDPNYLVSTMDEKERYEYHLENFKEALEYFKEYKKKKRVINLFKKYFDVK